MKCGAQSGLKQIWKGRNRYGRRSRNEVWCPVGIETHSNLNGESARQRRNEVWCPVGIEIEPIPYHLGYCESVGMACEARSGLRQKETH